MTLAACAKDVKFYTWPNINFVGVYEPPVECINVKTISWCCDRRQILVVKSKGTPIIINVPSDPEQCIEPLDCLNVNFANVGTYSNTNGNRAVFGFEDGEVHLYNIKNKQFLIDHKKLPGAIQYLELSANDHHVAVGCSTGQLFLLDSKLKPCASFMIPTSPTLSTLSFCQSNSNLLAAASKEGIISLWDIETADTLFFNKAHDGRITDIAFAKSTVSSVGIDGKFVSYDLRSRQVSSTCELDSPITSLAYVPGTYELAISTNTGQLRSYDVRNMGSPIRTFVANTNGGIKKIVFAKCLDDATTISKQDIRSKNIAKPFEDDLSASGDFSIITDSSYKGIGFNEQKPCDLSFNESAKKVPVCVEVVPIEKSPKIIELEQFGKHMEERLQLTSKEYEDKLLQHFYGLRIEASKQFIGLEDKINKSWSNFVEYLKLSGGTTVTDRLTAFSEETPVTEKVSEDDFQEANY